MKYVASAIIALLAPLCLGAYAPTPHIVPQPAKITTTDGAYALPDTMYVGGDMSAMAMKYLDMRGFLAMPSTENGQSLQAYLNRGMGDEAYELQIDSKGVRIEAGGNAGLMYAIETLSQIADQSQDRNVPYCAIEDLPRMGYRGLMLDVVRCYLPIDEVKKIVDVAAQLKINTLHLHLTDDNGWRMQIEKYPKLTEIGAWRVDRPELFPGRANPKEGEAATYGGFYTQDELRELVAYAEDRNINVIPEIEMPAHSVAAIASYPTLACPDYDGFIGVLPGIGAHAAEIILCAGNDSTLRFITDVLDEVMDVFPSQYIHLGGDEAYKNRWQTCPKCNARIEHEHLNGYEELQAWFMDSINSYVRAHGRTAIGWDEVTYGNPKEDMVIMGWQGDGKIAVDYARKTGRRFIMTPAKSTYLIRYQGPQWFEPFTYFGNITLKDAYCFDPVKDDWTVDMQDQLMGIQGSMWTEFCRTPYDVQRQVFPRMLGIADAAWRQQGSADWDYFVEGADAFLARLDDKGIAWAPSMYNIQHTILPNGDGTVTVIAENIRPDASISFTKSGENVVKEYGQPVIVDTDATFTFNAAFSDPNRKSEPLVLPLSFNKATGRIADAFGLDNGYAYALTNGLRGSLRNSDFEWDGFHNRTAKIMVDLGSPTPINEVSFGVLANANMLSGLPSEARLLISNSDNPDTFKLVRKAETDPESRFPLQPAVTDITFSDLGGVVARYIMIEADNAGPVPHGLPREDTRTWIYIDEVTVK